MLRRAFFIGMVMINMRKGITTIGIVCIIIAIIIELWLENYYSLVMIIPLLYLLNIRKRM